LLVSPPHTDIIGWHLGIRLEDHDSIPKLCKGEEGLWVIRIPLRSCNVRLLKDAAAIYVGVTGTDIYSGNSNYIFSSGVVLPNSQGTILSYYMIAGGVGFGSMCIGKTTDGKAGQGTGPGKPQNIEYPAKHRPALPLFRRP